MNKKTFTLNTPLTAKSFQLKQKDERDGPKGRYGAAPRKLRSYEVYLGDKLVGHTQQCYSESWRKSGRIRTSFIGYTYWWSVSAFANGKYVCGPVAVLSSRKAALKWIAQTVGTVNATG